MNGSVKCQIDILPISYAAKNKVGSAREEPNHSPFLPPPKGRFELSFNPLKMYQQAIGPELRRKICVWSCVGICVFICCYMLLMIFPSFLGAELGNLF